VTLPRSTRAGHGQLAGPAPSARQVRSITVRVEQAGDGILRLSSPTTPGWVGVARTPHELARLVASAFVENQVSAHSMWRGQPYEPPDGTRRRSPRSPWRQRTDTSDAAEWRVAEDGRWIAPGSGRSRFWSPDSPQVQQVMERRMRLGLPAVPEQISPGSSAG
jgi:hypothetical protein